jgi:dCMP deaminase
MFGSVKTKSSPKVRKMNKRPSWQQYFMDMAVLAATRSTCLRRQVGAVLVKDNQVLSTGYNGSPKGIPHCSQVGCLRETQNIPSGQMHELCRGMHAEQNAIIQSGLNGSSTRGATIYCTHQPCSICAKMIINAEIRTVYIADKYPDTLAEQLLAEAGVELIHYDIATGKMKRLI